MKKTRTIFSLLLAAAMLLSLCACSGSYNKNEHQNSADNPFLQQAAQSVTSPEDIVCAYYTAIFNGDMEAGYLLMGIDTQKSAELVSVETTVKGLREEIANSSMEDVDDWSARLDQVKTASELFSFECDFYKAQTLYYNELYQRSWEINVVDTTLVDNSALIEDLKESITHRDDSTEAYLYRVEDVQSVYAVRFYLQIITSSETDTSDMVNYVIETASGLYILPYYIYSGDTEASNTANQSGSAAEPVTQDLSVNISDYFVDFTIGDTFSEDRVHCYHIPWVLYNGAVPEHLHNALSVVNDTIYNELSSVLENYNNEQYTSLDYINYTWTQKGNVLSIWAETSMIDYDWTNHYIYNISIQSGEIVSNEAVLEEFGISEAEYIDMVKAAVTQIYANLSETVIASIGADEYNELLNKSLSEITLENTIPFVGYDGHLYAKAGYHWFAGAGWYENVLDLNTNERLYVPKCTQVHSNQTETQQQTEPTQMQNYTSLISNEELIGQWVVDEEYTSYYTSKSMWDIFGSSYSDGGNQMTFAEDGSFHYYVAWCYGKGTFVLDNDVLTVNVTEGDPSGYYYMCWIVDSGIVRIGFDILGDGTYVVWRKV